MKAPPIYVNPRLNIPPAISHSKRDAQGRGAQVCGDGLRQKNRAAVFCYPLVAARRSRSRHLATVRQVDDRQGPDLRSTVWG